MKNENLGKILNDITEKYAIEIVSWASYKFYYSKEDAEDLSQEVLLQIFKAVRSKYLRGELIEIESIDNYVRKIAKSVFNEHYKSLKFHREVQPKTIDFENIEENEKANNELVKRVRTCVANLGKLHRDVVVMYYLEQISSKDIASKLGYSERYILKVLETAKHLIRKKEAVLAVTPSLKYKPMKLKMSISGEQCEKPDTDSISTCLAKQNICLVCYYYPLDLDEVCEKTGLPKIYVEPELDWLIERGFIIENNKKYSTTFFILDSDFKAKIINIYMKHKTTFIDKIIDNLISKENHFKKIGFAGSDNSIDKLLWFLIYSFTDYLANQTGFNNKDKIYDYFVREDNGRYFPIGFHNFDSDVIIDEGFIKKYQEILQWNYNGSHIYDDGKNQMSWLELYQSDQKNLFYHKETMISDFMNYKDIILKSLNSSFDVNKAPIEERVVLSKLICENWLQIDVLNNKIQIEPNFYLFTVNQRKELDKEFSKIYKEVKSDIDYLISDIKLLCIEVLPKQLSNISDYVIYLCLMLSKVAALAGAFYDNKLYKPVDNHEYSKLTFNLTIKDNITTGKVKYIVLFRIAY